MPMKNAIAHLEILQLSIEALRDGAIQCTMLLRGADVQHGVAVQLEARHAVAEILFTLRRRGQDLLAELLQGLGLVVRQQGQVLVGVLG